MSDVDEFLIDSGIRLAAGVKKKRTTSTGLVVKDAGVASRGPALA
jgi:hypothetical protein